MNNGYIDIQIQSFVATVEFYHPASNSFPSKLLQKLAKSFNELSLDENVNAIILQSAGDKAFCAGASFNELIAISNIAEGTDFFMGFANVINAMRKCKKPIVARVQGKAVGGGVGLIAACDYVFALESSSIKLSELTIGIGPFVIAPAVERKAGVAALGELSLNATNWYSAYWAKDKGLFSQVFDSKDELNKYVVDFAQNVAKYNPSAVQEMKKVLWKNTDHWDKLLAERAEISGALVLSEFTKNALKKFKK